MEGRKVLLAGVLLLGAADLAVLDLLAAPAWVGSASPAAPLRHPSALPPPSPVVPAASASRATGAAPSIAPTALTASASSSAAASTSAAAEPSQPSAALPGAPKLAALLFQKGSALLTPDSVDVLMRASRFLKAAPQAALAIHGYAWQDDDDPQRDLWLSEKRAEVAAKFLVAVGVDRGRLRTMAHGSADPVERSGNAEALAHNRRVELVFEARTSSR